MKKNQLNITLPNAEVADFVRKMAKFRKLSVSEYLSALAVDDGAQVELCAKCGAPILDLREFTVLSGEVKITCPGCKFESVLKHANEIK